jgi:hypothetical protein
MRIILSKVLFHFDMALEPESDNWREQEVYTLWQKPALKVKYIRLLCMAYCWLSLRHEIAGSTPLMTRRYSMGFIACLGWSILRV